MRQLLCTESTIPVVFKLVGCAWLVQSARLGWSPVQHGTGVRTTVGTRRWHTLTSQTSHMQGDVRPEAASCPLSADRAGETRPLGRQVHGPPIYELLLCKVLRFTDIADRFADRNTDSVHARHESGTSLETTRDSEYSVRYRCCGHQSGTMQPHASPQPPSSSCAALITRRCARARSDSSEAQHRRSRDGRGRHHLARAGTCQRVVPASSRHTWHCARRLSAGRSLSAPRPSRASCGWCLVWLVEP
jgi:hypothetical protein